MDGSVEPPQEPVGISRRSLLRRGAGAAVVGLAAGSLGLPEQAGAVGATDDSSDRSPFAIPWLDQYLHHNQGPYPGSVTELSLIYNFQGTVGRTKLSGSGRTGDGRTLYLGQGTNYGFSSGQYVAANGNVYEAAFAHI